MDMTLLKSVAVVLLYGIVAAGIRAADDPALTNQGDESAEMQRQMETAAEHYSYFATSDIILNRPTDRQWPEKLIAEQAKLMAEMQRWARQPRSLHALIGHSSAKVRTLVLGALFVREDPHDLPLIASLVADDSPTFAHVHLSLNSAPGTGKNLKDILDSQTVGQVAEAMIVCYRQAAPLSDDCRFAEYWRAREGRQSCASWFLVRINRATRLASPPLPEYQRDIQRVITELKALPPDERAWTQVFLRGMSSIELDATLTDAMCIAALKEIGPDQIVRFLERQRVTDDPDLWFDNLEHTSSRAHSFMAHFIFHHVRELLRVQDVPALLAREEVERKTPQSGIGASPSWAAAAAQLIGDSDPAAASKIIDAALGRFPLSDISGGQHQAVLIGSLWRIHGAKEKQKIVDWFYRAQANDKRKSDASNNGPFDFLRSVRAAGREDTPELIAALVADPQLDQTGLPAMNELLDIASEGLPEPLYDWREFYSVDGRSEKGLVKWHDILKRHYKQ